MATTGGIADWRRDAARVRFDGKHVTNGEGGGDCDGSMALRAVCVLATLCALAEVGRAARKSTASTTSLAGQHDDESRPTASPAPLPCRAERHTRLVTVDGAAELTKHARLQREHVRRTAASTSRSPCAHTCHRLVVVGRRAARRERHRRRRARARARAVPARVAPNRAGALTIRLALRRRRRTICANCWRSPRPGWSTAFTSTPIPRTPHVSVLWHSTGGRARARRRAAAAAAACDGFGERRLGLVHADVGAAKRTMPVCRQPDPLPGHWIRARRARRSLDRTADRRRARGAAQPATSPR